MKNFMRNEYLIILSIFLLSFCSSHKEGEWRGAIKNENGVTIVKNPDEPMYNKEIIIFQEEMSIGKISSPAEVSVGDIMCFTVDDKGNVFIGDGENYCIEVFNKNGQHLRTIGKKGQGPGEFTSPPAKIQLTPKNEIMVSGNSLKFFSIDGWFLRTFKNPIFLFSNVLMGADGQLYIYRAEFDGKEKIYRMIPPYEKYEILVSVEAERTTPPPRLRYAIVSGDKLAWGFSTEYRIYISDKQGKIIRIIEKEHKPLPLTIDWKSKYLNSLPKGFPKKGHNFRKYFPAFDYFFADDEGRLFVKTFEKEESTEKYIFDVFDPEGRYLTKTALKVGREISLKQDSFIIKNNKLYAEDYDDDGYAILKRYSVTWINLK